MAYDYEGRGQDVEVKGSTYRIPKDEDIADAPLAFEDYTNSIPFSEYVEVVEVDSDTTVDDSYNGKMIVATESVTLTFGTLKAGFTVAAVAESDAAIAYLGVDKENESTSEYEVATVVTVNETNILSVARAGASTPECPECPDEGPDLIGGVAGWAAIESVSGAADLDDLKAAGIAPMSATADDDCVGTYNITQDGVVWRVAVFTGDGSVSTSDGVVDALVVAGGATGGLGSWGGGGAFITGLQKFTGPTLPVKVGSGATVPGTNAGWSQLGDFKPDGPTTVATGAAQHIGYPGDDPAKGFQSSITGTPLTYSESNVPIPRANSGSGRNENKSAAPWGAASDGIVIVRAPKDAASNPKPDAPVAWGRFENVPAGYTETGDWGPDSQGRTWKYYEFANEGDFEIDLSGGQYWVLAVGGGAAEYDNTTHLWSGQAGLVNEGYWEFGEGSTSVTVGAKGTTGGVGSIGSPSSIGGYGTQGGSWWGNSDNGRGSTTYGEDTGYKSSITGKSLEYANGSTGEERPGRASQRDLKHTDGCVIIATVTNEPSYWNPPGSLPGIGGWATVTEVKGKGTKYEYGDWVAFEWTDTDNTGSMKIAEEGLVEVLIVGGGAATSGDGSIRGSGGGVITGIELLGVNNTVVVGKGGNGAGNSTTSLGQYSQLGEMRIAGGTRAISPNGFNKGVSGGYYAGAGSAGDGEGRTTGGVGVVSSIRTGVDEMYASGGGDYRAPVNERPGDGAHGDNQQSGGYAMSGNDGVVIIRVPKSSDLSGLEGSEAGTPFDTTTLREALRETAAEKVKSNRKRRK